MATVYTVRFIASVAAGVQVTYTVPAGYRAVVTSVTSTNATSATHAVEVRVGGIYVFSQDVLAFKSAAMTGMRVVAYAGETIQLYHQAAGQHSHVNGYLFAESGFAQAEGDVTFEELPAPMEDREWAAPRPSQ